MTNEREQRGLAIAATCKLTKRSDFWLVPSQSTRDQYIVRRPCTDNPHCTCPDHETRGIKCKHVFAVEITIRREQHTDGSVTTTVVRKTYAQNWTAYNAAQTNEKDHFQRLLHDLCSGIEEPERTGRGRRPIPLRDSLFAAVFKVYSTQSGRRFMSDLRESERRGYVSQSPCYNSVFNILESKATTKLLHRLILESALPLKSLESQFACDSSGFGSSRFDRWYDHKWGGEKFMRAWVKCHLMCGVKTNVVTAVEIKGPSANDCPLLPKLLNKTAKKFDVQEVSADMGYLSKENFEAIRRVGADAYIPFKSNTTGARGGLFKKMFHLFQLNQEEYMKHYHVRSNVESTFAMIKAKFGDSVRSRTDTAMMNEVMAKVVCHNICCVIQSWYELGIEPTFCCGQAI